MVDTPFQLISGFFHVNQGVLCSEHAEQASSRGVLEGGGGGGGGGGNRLAKWRGSNKLPGLVTKQQAMEFPQVLTSQVNNSNHECSITLMTYVPKGFSIPYRDHACMRDLTTVSDVIQAPLLFRWSFLLIQRRIKTHSEYH